MRLYFVLLLLTTVKLYGQMPSDTKFYLANKNISKTAKDFYNGKFKASDDKRTFSIIDSIQTKNNLTRPFYIYLISKILDKADGALSEELGINCKRFIEQNPNQLIDFLYSHKKISEKKFIDNWAKAVAGEFMIDCEGKEKECITKSMQVSLKNTRSDNKLTLLKFYSKVKSYCHQQ